MGAKDKRGSPILKIGVALVFSIGGIVYTFFRRNKQGTKNPSKPKPPISTPGNCSQGDDNHNHNHALQDSSAPINACSPNGTHDGDRESSILLEFNELLNEYDTSVGTDKYEYNNNGESYQEISNLKNKVKYLEEREKILETQLLEYYGLKEQESAVLELQSRLRLQNMETKLYKVKIESLQSENKKLQAQVADYAKVVTELEAAKAKINHLTKKLSSEAKENREQILKLQERVMKLLENENKKDIEETGCRQDVEMELHSELEELRELNHKLKLENIELTEKLNSLQMITTPPLPDEEIEALKAEKLRVGQENGELSKEIEHLQEARCTDLEELVYLRWINACLRYELRNYQPGQGEAVARDLSKTLSPKSEEKAKQLILKYANKEGYERDKVVDFEYDQWSTSQLTDSDHLSAPGKTTHSGKKRVFAKLMKLLQGKDTPASPLDMAESVDNYTISRSNSHSSRQSSDFQRHKHAAGESSRRMSYDGYMSIFRKLEMIGGYEDVGIQPHQDAENAAKTELVKYAEALKNSRGKSSRVHRRAASLSFI